MNLLAEIKKNNKTALSKGITLLESSLENLHDDIIKSSISPPAIICIGKSVLMRQVLNWQHFINGGSPTNIDPLNRNLLTKVS